MVYCIKFYRRKEPLRHEKSRLSSFALSLLVLCACDAPPAEPSGETTDETSGESSVPIANPASDFLYEETSDGGIVVTDYIGESTDVVIPETIDGKPVTEIGLDFANMVSMDPCKVYVKSVWMPDTVWHIGGSAFEGQDELEIVRFSEGLISIDGSAFCGCDILSSITLPESLQYLGGPFTFAHMASLKEITIPKNLVDIGLNTFWMSSLEKVNFAEDSRLELIGQDVFGFTKLKEVTLPVSVKKLGIGAFRLCPSLTKVVLNDGLECIDTGAFAGSGVTELVVPASVTDMNCNSFVRGDDQALKVYFMGDLPEDFFLAFLSYGYDYPVFCLHEGAKGFDLRNANLVSIETW